MKLTDNTILITGASAGIGFGLAEALLQSGNRVLTCARRADRLERAQKLLPRLECLQCDIGATDGRRALVDWALARAPELNVLINNAGVQHKVSFTEGEDADARDFEEIAVNLQAPMHLVQLLIAHLKSRPNPAIVNISSGLAFTPAAFVPIYSATKAAIHSFSQSLRHQLRNTPVRVYECAPPLVESELHDHQKGPAPALSAMPTAEFVAACLKGLADDVEMNAVGFAAGLYAEREKLFSRLNPP
jgi:uncharacterized oxidoreductase